MLEQVVQAQIKRLAVGQSGQDIVVGHIAQFFVFFAAFTDILKGIDRPFGIAVVIEKNRTADGYIYQSPVFGKSTGLYTRKRGPTLNLCQEFFRLGLVRLGHEIDGPVAAFIQAPSKHTGKGRVQVDDPVGHVSDDNRIRCRFQHGTMPRLTFFQCLLGPFACGDVPVDNIDGRLVILRGDRLGQDGYIHRAAVFFHPYGLHLKAATADCPC